MSATPRILEPQIDWRASDVSDPNRWTVRLDDNDQRELDEALTHAKSVSHDLLDIDRDAFPLPTLSAKLAEIERELIDGRGFVRLSRLAAERYSDDDFDSSLLGHRPSSWRSLAAEQGGPRHGRRD